MEPYSSEVLYIVIAAFVVSFLLAFGVGANDVANSFGTSVGAKVLSLRKACVLGSIFEVLGAVLIGYKVSDTVRKGIIDVELYRGSEKLLMLGFLAALGGSAVWNLVATALSLPISGTHTIVGATLGFTAAAHGLSGVNWYTFSKIISSWFVSPILSGIISVTFYFIVSKAILNSSEPIRNGLLFLPVFYSFTVLVNVFSVVHDGPEMLYFHLIPVWGSILIALGFAIVTGIVVQFWVVPYQRRKINAMLKERDRKAKFVFGSTVDVQNRPESIEMAGLLRYKDNSRASTPPQDLATMENGTLTPNSVFVFEEKTKRNGYISSTKVNGQLEDECNKKLLTANAPLTVNNLSATSVGQSEASTTITNKSITPLTANSPTSPLSEFDHADELYDSAITSSSSVEPAVDQNISNGCVELSEGSPVDHNLVVQSKPHVSIDMHPSSPRVTFMPSMISGAESQSSLCGVASDPQNGSSKALIDNNSQLPLVVAQDGSKNTSMDEVPSSEEDTKEIEDPVISTLFSFLQILTATFGSFAHGGNDVSNAIGPLIAIHAIYIEGSVAQQSEPPIWILFFGGVGISVGLWLWGRRVIKTIGEDLTKVTPASGFTIEIGSAFTVLLASKIGLPISTTHCKVGSVVFVGWCQSSRQGVSWKLFRNIVAAWLVTVPLTTLMSWGLMTAFMYFFM